MRSGDSSFWRAGLKRVKRRLKIKLRLRIKRGLKIKLRLRIKRGLKIKLRTAEKTGREAKPPTRGPVRNQRFCIASFPMTAPVVSPW